MSSSKKRKQSETRGFYIGLSEATVEKRPDSIKLPNKLTRVPPPKDSPSAWFGWKKPVEYHPMCIFDADTKEAIKESNRSITLTLSFDDENGIPSDPFSVTAKGDKKGLYWFFAPEAYSLGTITMKFTCSSSDIPQLEIGFNFI